MEVPRAICVGFDAEWGNLVSDRESSKEWDGADDWADLDEEEEDDLEREPPEYQGESSLSPILMSGGETGLLALTGVSSGRVVKSADEVGGTVDTVDAEPLSAVRTRDEALDSGLPILFLHWGARYCRLMTSVLAHLFSEVGEVMSFGTTASIPRRSHDRIVELSDLDVSSISIADPEAYLSDAGGPVLIDDDHPSDRHVTRAPYLASYRGKSGRLEQILDVQRQLRSNLLLTPGHTIDHGDPDRSLDQTWDEATEVRDLLGDGERMALNLTITGDWLRSRGLRERLLAEILDHREFDVVYLRVQWPARQNSSTALLDGALLEGYAELSAMLSGEQRCLILPQSGLTGWALLAKGARGFSTGANGSDQGFFPPTGGGNPPLNRFFDRGVVHHVDPATYLNDLVGAEDHIPCSCVWGQAALSSSGVWNHEYAAAHDFYSVGLLVAELIRSSDSVGPISAGREIVDAAVAFHDSVPLTGRDRALHLSKWQEMLGSDQT